MGLVFGVNYSHGLDRCAREEGAWVVNVERCLLDCADVPFLKRLVVIFDRRCAL